ncbi:UbiA prenyltransferase family [Fomitopsis serialis]|uniref:UbiA prenyltransferase family n=1 Tax=Fomitopsis serialis TaxID=139415 RepID=UPI002007E102|nr:UbiA prenyltransferase family [Neoantrodia serialis]KAH9911514.1 UbiA prenyltransferase family [Neoantrodia serialis]
MSLNGAGRPNSKRATWVAYYRLTRKHNFPTGLDVVFWPCTWGLIMSAYALRLSPRSLAIQLAAYFVGATLRHSAACIWNDMCDIEIDRKVASLGGAAILLAAHFIACLVILSYAGDAAFKWGLFCLCFLDPLYPLMKRWTDWPQLWLGFAMTWGLPVSWVSNFGEMNWYIVPVLLGGGVCWTIHYDTIYACQDRRDDIKAGVRSTAVLFGDWTRLILACFSACFVICLALAGGINHQGPLFFITVAGTAFHLAWQLIVVDLDDSSDCHRIFKVSSVSCWRSEPES